MGTDREPVDPQEHFRGMSVEQIRYEVEQIEDRLRSLHQDAAGKLRTKSAAEQAEFNEKLRLRDAGRARLEEHEVLTRALARGAGVAVVGGPAVVGRASGPQADALRAAERLSGVIPGDRQGPIEREIRGSDWFAAEFAAHADPAYESAFGKLMRYDAATAPLRMSEEERAAVATALHASEMRAMSEGTTTAGGFGVPVQIDPSIIMTSQGSNNPFLQIARGVTATSNVWKGVTSAGVSWSFDAEAEEVSDDSPTLAQPTVTVYMARGFIPYSIEVSEDYPSFAAEMQQLLASGYDELLADKFTRGSGTAEPQGLLTALSAASGCRVTLTTSGAIGTPDPYKVWAALPERFRSRANWLMSVDVNNKIRQLGTTNVYHAYTVALPAGAADQLMNSPVRTSAYMPDSTTSTSATIGLAAVGDFGNYVVARRSGMRVEVVNHLLGLTNNRPTGQRGLFAYARIGGGCVNTSGFRLLVNT